MALDVAGFESLAFHTTEPCIAAPDMAFLDIAAPDMAFLDIAAPNVAFLDIADPDSIAFVAGSP